MKRQMGKNQVIEKNIALEPEMFIYKAAHDLRAPVMSVKGLIDMMRKDNGRENLEHYLGLIEHSMDKMNQSIESIIGTSKNGTPKIVSLPVDVKKIAQECIQSVRYMSAQDSIRIELLVNQENIFFAKEQSLKSIFTNLLSNAIRYRDKTKLSFIQIRITFDNQGVCIVFKDNGIGIEEKLQDKVFAKFFRVHDDVEGSGLGLFIVKSEVENMNGTIKLNSSVGLGTEFVIRIPNREA